MAEYQINIDDELLHDLFSGDEGLRILVEQVLNEVLEGQVTEQLQAAPYERTENRQGYRNGYRLRPITTRVGTLELMVPRVRNGHFSTKLFSRYQRSEQAFCTGFDGDGCQWSFYEKGSEDHGGALRDKLFQEYGVKPASSTG